MRQMTPVWTPYAYDILQKKVLSSALGPKLPSQKIVISFGYVDEMQLALKGVKVGSRRRPALSRQCSKRVCPSVRRSVRLSVRPSVGNLFFLNAKNAAFS